MTIGTRSILFGAHCFFIHPVFLFIAWWRLYGFPWNPKLWVAFVVHDLGYWGKPNMDGEEGESHPELGARIMRRLFDWGRCSPKDQWEMARKYGAPNWHDFSLYHSRFYARRHRVRFSRLCVADKLATCITPRWLYLLSVRLTGEIHEYMEHHNEARRGRGKYHEEQEHDQEVTDDARVWHARMIEFMLRWVEDNK